MVDNEAKREGTQEQGKVSWTGGAKIDLAPVQSVLTSTVAAFFICLIVFGLFASCSIAMGWNVGQRFSEAIGVKDKGE